MILRLADSGRRPYVPLSEPISATIATVTTIKGFLDSPIGQSLSAQVHAWLGRVFPKAERDRLNAFIDELMLAWQREYNASTGKNVNWKTENTVEFATFVSNKAIALLNRLASEPVPADNGGKRVKARYIQASRDILEAQKSRLQSFINNSQPVFVKPSVPQAPVAPGQPAPPQKEPGTSSGLNVQTIGIGMLAAKLLGIF